MSKVIKDRTENEKNTHGSEAAKNDSHNDEKVADNDKSSVNDKQQKQIPTIAEKKICRAKRILSKRT